MRKPSRLDRIEAALKELALMVDDSESTGVFQMTLDTLVGERDEDADVAAACPQCGWTTFDECEVVAAGPHFAPFPVVSLRASDGSETVIRVRASWCPYCGHVELEALSADAIETRGAGSNEH